MSSNDIVLSGMGCRLPESCNTDQYWNNLVNGVDMVTNKDDRWPDGTYSIVNRMGRIPDMHSFDSPFFGIIDHLTEELHPPHRILLETTYEAIIDAGMLTNTR